MFVFWAPSHQHSHSFKLSYCREVKIYATETKLIEYSSTSHPPGEFLSPTLQTRVGKWMGLASDSLQLGMEGNSAEDSKRHVGTSRFKRKEKVQHTLPLSPHLSFSLLSTKVFPSSPSREDLKLKQCQIYSQAK